MTTSANKATTKSLFDLYKKYTTEKDTKTKLSLYKDLCNIVELHADGKNIFCLANDGINCFYHRGLGYQF